MKILITGTTGKVGKAFLPAFLEKPQFSSAEVVALCHNRRIEAGDRVACRSASCCIGNGRCDPRTAHGCSERKPRSGD